MSEHIQINSPNIIDLALVDKKDVIFLLSNHKNFIFNFKSKMAPFNYTISKNFIKKAIEAIHANDPQLRVKERVHVNSKVISEHHLSENTTPIPELQRKLSSIVSKLILIFHFRIHQHMLYLLKKHYLSIFLIKLCL